MSETGRQHLIRGLEQHGETLEDIVSIVYGAKTWGPPGPDDPEQYFKMVPIDSGYGGFEGATFTAWTTSRVYFWVEYDGAQWVDSVPRNPCDEVVTGIGG